jgi:ribose/xylose/arabinose/galactoside ABC-type transport system permease subunit
MSFRFPLLKKEEEPAKTHSMGKNVIRFFGPVIGLIFVYVIFLIFAPSAFSSLYNTKNILTQAVIIGIAALGMTVIIISGGIDLSAGSQIAFTTVLIAVLINRWGGPDMGLFVPLAAALVAILGCTLVGALNGLMVAGLRVVPFIATLGMMQIARGVAKGIAGQTSVPTHASWLNEVMVVEPRAGVFYSLAPGVWVMLFFTLLMAVVLRYTVFGRYVFAIGSNEKCARLCGIRVGLNRLMIYTLGGAITGIAGVMQFSNLTLGDPTAATGMELDIIASVVIGGGSLSGGEGSIGGSLVGALIMAILRNGCTLVGIPNYVQNIVIGGIIIVAVTIDRLKHRRPV